MGFWKLGVDEALDYWSGLGYSLLVQIRALLDLLYLAAGVGKAEFVGRTACFNQQILFTDGGSSFRLRFEGFGRVFTEVAGLGLI